MLHIDEIVIEIDKYAMLHGICNGKDQGKDENGSKSLEKLCSHKQKNLEFSVANMVFIKVAAMKGVMRF